MENEYQFPASLFANLSDVFEPCSCGAKPFLGLIFGGDFGSDIQYFASCPDCGRMVSMEANDQKDLNFVWLSFSWNFDKHIRPDLEVDL